MSTEILRYRPLPRESAALVDGDERIRHDVASGRRAYVHVVRGRVDVNGVALAAGDAAEIEKEGAIEISNADRAEILVFDLD